MKLSAAQIEQLFVFTEKKYVRYYDLQVELVDHLATNIEEALTNNSKLTFNEALTLVYSEFGIFGFAKIVQQKEEQVLRAGKKLLLKEIRNYFRWPQITFVAFIAILTWQLTVWVNMEILLPAFYFAWISASVWLIIILTKCRGRQKKKLLSIQFAPVFTNGSIFFVECMYFSWGSAHSSIVFCFIVTLGILLKLAAYKVYVAVRNKAYTSYPEAFA